MKALVFSLLVLVSCGKNATKGTDTVELTGENSFLVSRCESNPSCSGSCKTDLENRISSCWSSSRQIGNPGITSRCISEANAEYPSCISRKCTEACTLVSVSEEEKTACVSGCI